MLNFTKFKIIFIYFIFIALSAFAFLNIISSEKPILQKKINLGLDLQGGSYLLLEVDTRSLIEERLQDKVLELKKFLKSKNFDFNSFNINQNSISFKMNNNQKEKKS